MKKILFVAVFVLLNWNFVFCQNVEPDNPLVEISTSIENEKLIYSFTNHKDFEESKIDRFTSRLINYYEIVDNIEYNSQENLFIIDFNSLIIDEQELKEILSHFDVYHYSIIKN